MHIHNETIRSHAFLRDVLGDIEFPREFAERGKIVLLRLCERIERTLGGDQAEIVQLARDASQELLRLAQEFSPRGTEVRPGILHNVRGDILMVLKTYGVDIDVDTLIAPPATQFSVLGKPH